MQWTVARFPSGQWSTGGKPDSPDYSECEVFVVESDSRVSATRKAQAMRQRQRKKSAELIGKKIK